MTKDPRFGPTGRFPEGKFTMHDQGELRFGVTHRAGQIIVNFGKPVAWFTMGPELARTFAEVLLHHAEEVEAGR